ETSTCDDITTRRVTDFSLDEQPDYLPMSGESGVITGLVKGATVEVGTIELIRAVATFEITRNAETVTNFDLHTVQAFRANKLVQIIPNGNPVMASVPGNSGQYNSVVIGNQNQAVQTLSELYLPESEAKTGDAQTTEATCLVIGGKYNGSNELTYYRVDIKSIGGSNFGQILRNTKYKILITKVAEDGYPSAQDAADNPAGNMEVNIIEINDGGGEVIVDADGNMLMLNNNPILVGYYAGATASSLVGTTATTYSVQWFDAGFSQSDVIIQWEKGEENNDVLQGHYFDIRIISRDDMSDPTYTFSALQITARDTYTGNERLERNEYAIISMGDLHLKFNIIQKSRNTFEYDFIDIFSYTDLFCTLGDEVMFPSQGINGVSGPVLINTIKNTDFFSPTGIVPIGGFDISGLPSSSSFMTPRLADIFDVIFLPGGMENVLQPTSELYTVLYNWLGDYNTRVLITAMDNLTLEEVFPIKLAIDGDEWWWDLAKSTGNYEISTEAPEFILKGPFGKINSGDELLAGKDAWGNPSTQILYADENPSITPILTIKDQPNEIVLGIDLGNRVIYYADYTWFHAGSTTFSQTNNLSTPADILLANLFAWIADTVMGEKLAPDVE
ncbi:MAG: hypothetical protein LUD74_07120, partial [Tannerellaceae bacterium]|nr:hypothetical protein [Tannerellaceae bacterium]